MMNGKSLQGEGQISICTSGSTKWDRQWQQRLCCRGFVASWAVWRVWPRRQKYHNVINVIKCLLGWWHGRRGHLWSRIHFKTRQAGRTLLWLRRLAQRQGGFQSFRTRYPYAFLTLNGSFGSPGVNWASERHETQTGCCTRSSTGSTNTSLPHKFFPSGFVNLHPKKIFWLNVHYYQAHHWYTAYNKELITFSLCSPYQLKLPREVPSPAGGIWAMCTVLEVTALYFENSNPTQFNQFLSYSLPADASSLFIHFVSFIEIKNALLLLLSDENITIPLPQLMLFLRKWCRTLIRVVC